MSATDDALDVARFCFPRAQVTFIPHNREHIAAAERVLVERGLGEEYGAALCIEIHGRAARMPMTWVEVAKVATAPLDVRLRAMARVAREQKPKEKA